MDVHVLEGFFSTTFTDISEIDIYVLSATKINFRSRLL